MLINILLIVLLTKITDVKSLNNTHICNPIYNCPPGHEIRSCLEAGTSDICKLCKPGTVQPDYISSHTLNKNCFLPMSLCLAADITYSRHRRHAFCDSLTGCKCNLTMCFYGDPCLCDLKRDGCPENEFLEENGECTPCPNGAAKNGTGCGPCMYQPVDVKKHVTVGVQEVEDTDFIDNIENAGLEDTRIDSTSWIPNITSKPMAVDIFLSKQVVIIIAVLICVLVAMTIALIYRKRNDLPLCRRKLHQQFKKKNDANMDLYKIEAAKMIQDSPVYTDLFVPVSASHNQSTVHLKKNGHLA